MISLNQLVTPITEDDALASIIATLEDSKFQASSWQSGSIQLTFIRLAAMIWAQASIVIAAIAQSLFSSLATIQYAYLALIALYWYNIAPLEAQFTVGEMLLTSNAQAGTTTFASGDIIVADQPNGTLGANVYTCTAGGTLGPSSTLLVQFKANTPGTAANIPPNTTLFLWTGGLVGITVTNPVVDPTSTWITTPGQDQETVARLAARCLNRWSALAYGNMDGAYTFWALTALPSLTRSTILSAPGDGTVTLVGANSLGPISGADCTTIQNYVRGVSDGIGRRPINDIFSAIPATVVSSPALTVTVYCVPDAMQSVVGAITSALNTYLGTVPIGGTLLTGSTGVVIYDDLVDTAKSALGDTAATQNASRKIRSVALNISTNIPLSPGQIYSPAITVNPIAVAPGV